MKDGDEDVGELGVCCDCHLSTTDETFAGRSGVGVALAPPGDGRLGEVPASNSLLSFTRLCTKPRPCNLLRLGVSSLVCSGFRKAGDGFLDGGICGPDVGGDRG